MTFSSRDAFLNRTAVQNAIKEKTTNVYAEYTPQCGAEADTEFPPSRVPAENCSSFKSCNDCLQRAIKPKLGQKPDLCAWLSGDGKCGTFQLNPSSVKNVSSCPKDVTALVAVPAGP